MEEHTLSKEQHLDLLKRALSANIAARERYDLWCQQQARNPNDDDPLPKGHSLDELLRTPYAQLSLEAIISDATVESLREQLKELGQQLFELLGSTAAMLAVAEEIAGDPKNLFDWQYRINPFDKHWDGIGAGNDHWVA